ncbi:hypothetical protein PAHAL_7G239900 [Panicum hallii]|uniref:Uncharacterized protein n=1 Tax=Panicum hallii TaxID=206008 RepID=A0A2T8IDA7_9POAL|nr:hypothetical protein PAHAL_7G239900 [Panicum hallii]
MAGSIELEPHPRLLMNFHRPMNHTYMTATTGNAIRKPSINTTIHVSIDCTLVERAG